MSLRKKIAVAAFIAVLAAVAVLTAGRLIGPRSYIIGIVNNNHGLEMVVTGFKKGMERYGYIEGKNVHYVYGGALKDTAQIDAALSDLIARKADIILTVATPVTLKAKELTKGTEIPVVFAPVFLPVESGLVESLIRPGGNMTGIQIGGSTQKALEWHKAAFPRARRVFVPYTPDEPASIQSLGDLMKAAGKLGVELILAEVRKQDDLKSALNGIPGRADSIWLLNSPFFVENIGLFTDAALKRGLALSSGTSQIRHGVLLSFSQRPVRTGEQASRLASHILDGIPPSELPVETVDYFLSINLRTAADISINVPEAVLQQADNVIR